MVKNRVKPPKIVIYVTISITWLVLALQCLEKKFLQNHQISRLYRDIYDFLRRGRSQIWEPQGGTSDGQKLIKDANNRDYRAYIAILSRLYRDISHTAVARCRSWSLLLLLHT